HTRFSRDWSSDVCSSDLRSSSILIFSASVRLAVVNTCSSESRSCPKLTIGTSAPSSHKRSVRRIPLNMSFFILIASCVLFQWFDAEVAVWPCGKNPHGGVWAVIRPLHLCFCDHGSRLLN